MFWGDVERRYDNTVQAVCWCGRVDPFKYKPHDTFAKALNEEDSDVLALDHVAYCVCFLRQEVFCVPPFLHNKMVRAIEGDNQQRVLNQRRWMNCAVVDSLPVSVLDNDKYRRIFHWDTAS